MKSYAEVITELAQQKNDNLMNGGQGRTDAAAIVGFIYDVLERDVEIDIDEEYIKMVDSRGK